MFGAAYTAIQRRIAYLARSTDATLPVAACPGWTVTDVVRHLSGLACDVVSGDVDGYGGEEWTARQVTSRADLPLMSVLDEWTTVTARLVDVLDDLERSSLPEMVRTAAGPAPRATFAAAIVGDALHHEHDIRAAVRSPGDPNDPMVLVSGAGQVKMLRPAFAMKGLPTLRVILDPNEPIDVGRDEPAATVRLSAFEAFRATGGRRTKAEIAAYDWDGDRATFLDHMVIPFMQVAAASIGEAQT